MTASLLRPFLLAGALAACLLTAGCAGVRAPGDDGLQAYRQWQTSALEQARGGSLAWSSYYQQSFDRLATLPPSLEQDARLEATVNLLSLARKRDAGEISPSAFEEQRATLEAGLQRRLR